MRTTLTIDDDVLTAARERAARERRSVGAVLSELAREALVGLRPGPDGPPGPGVRGFRPLPSRGGVVTRSLVEQLREDELS